MSEIKAHRVIKAGKTATNGIFMVGDQYMVYFIMPRFGDNLEEHLLNYGFPSKSESIILCI
jgi:hypothetical protein